ncbi:T9SS type A sorting domain-containing protein, partial [Polaribacter sp.]|nr:T9SS type A sorting domain-containing protein [Polaribacter sp.]
TQTSFLDVSLNSSSVRIFAIGNVSSVSTLKRSIDDGATWSTIASPSGVTINSVYGVPNTNTVYATVSSYSATSKIYKSINNGDTWTNISGDMPNIIMYKIVADPNKTNETLYVGTELGLYFTDNTTTNWTKLGTGLPNVRVSDIKISKNNGNVYIGTFGRGMWVYNDQKYFDNTIPANVYWSDATSWEGETLPTITDDVFIKAAENVTLDSNGAVAKSIEIADTGFLTIEKNADLTIEENFDATSTNSIIKIYSDVNDSGVLIIKGTATTGKVEFERGGLIGNKWSLVSVPVEGQKIVEFGDLVTNDIRLNETPDPDRYAIAVYNDANSVGNKWVYYDYDEDQNTTFTKNKGYIMSRNTNGSVTFTGTLLTNTETATVASSQWNAIGNPYTAYYPANKNSNVSFVSDNAASLESPAVYIWDITQEKYVAASELVSSDQFGIPPGQGFFVKTKTAVTSLTFNKDKRGTKSGSDDENVFNKTENDNTPFLKLFVKKGAVEVRTDVIYSETATLGLDVNEDILNFDSSSFDVATQLLANNVGKNYTIQSLPKDNFDTHIIPIILTVEENNEVVFRVEKTNISDDVNIYLEDKSTNKFHQLTNENGFKLTTSKQESNKDRFYLHLSKSVLSVDALLDDTVKVFNINKKLQVNGLYEGDIKLQLFDITGKQILVDTQKGNGNNTFNLDNFNTGVYLVKLSFAKETLTKKIVLK